MRSVVGRLVLVAGASAAFALPASAAATQGPVVVTQGTAKLVPAGTRVPNRPPAALRTFRTLDPLALQAGRAAAARQYANSSPQSALSAPNTVLFGGLSWDGLAAGDTVNVTPPDGGGGIGPNDYVEAINERITVYNRSTTSSVATADLSTFSGLSGACDPYVMWDQGAQRWVIITIECASLADHALSISFTKSTDPTDLVSGWCHYTLDTGTEFPDYPKAGHNNSDWLVGVNDYSTSGGNPFNTAELIAFKKPANGTISTCPGSLTNDTLSGAPLSANGDQVFTAEPADQVDSGAPPSSGTASDNGYFVAYVFGSGSAVHVYRFNRDSGGAAHFTFEGDIGVASYTFPGTVPQPGTSNTLSSSDTRGVGATGHADPKRCGGCEAIWITHAVDGAGGRSQVQWEELNPGACTGSTTCPSSALLQDGDVASSTLFDFNGRMAPAGNGYDAVMNFDSGSSSQLSQINAISNTAGDPAGRTHGQLLIATSAAADQDFSCSPCRWGDYAAAETDPTNSDTVWNNSMYLGVANGGNAQWKTRLFAVRAQDPATVAVSLSAPSIVANGASTSTATATVTDASSAPIAGDAVAFSSSDPGEHISSVTDNGNGTYTATITSSTTVGRPTITATDSSGSPSVAGSATLVQTPGPATNVAVSLSPGSIVADGASTTTATASVRDALGHPVSGDHVSFSSNHSGDHVGSVTDHGDGTYSVPITSSTHPGTAKITATDSSVSPAVSGSATVSETPLVGHVKVLGTTANVPLSCTGHSSCSVKLTLTVPGKPGKTTLVRARRTVIVIGKAVVTLGGGSRKTVRVKLNKVGKSLLASRHKLAVTLTVKVAGRTVFSQTLHFKATGRKHGVNQQVWLQALTHL